MDTRKLSLIAFLVVLLAACAAPSAQPTSTPETPSQVEPTTGPDEPVSATPLPPGVEQPPGPTPPYNPAPGDEQLQRGEVFIDSTQMIVAESFPPQFFLSLQGSLPTPCHQLRVVVSAPDPNNRIMVDVYSLADPNTVCIQVLEPFEVNVRLGTFDTGKYEVWVNNQPIGEIDAP